MAKFLPNDVNVDRLLLQLKLAAYSWQEQLFKSRAEMVLLNCSRQAGKSTCVAFLALLEALTIQEHLVLMLSPSARQSRLLLGKVRDFMLRMPLKAVQRAQVNAERIEFPNLSRIVALPCKEETIRGYSSVGLLIIDEAARVPDELYQAVRPMLAASDGRIICLSTPFGRVGFFYDAWTSPTQQWERISARAEDVPHIKAEFLTREREIMLPATYAQEYQCEFTTLEGLVYPDFLKQTAWSPELEKQMGPKLVGGVDFGFRNPFAALWGRYDPKSGLLVLTGERYQRGLALSEHLSYLPRRVKWYCDPAGANERAEMTLAGHEALSSRNEIAAGIARVREWLALGLIKIMPGACPNLLEEAQRYRYDTDVRRSRSELPVDEYNHGMAGLRYLVMGLPRPKKRVEEKKGPTAEEKHAAYLEARRRYLKNAPGVWRPVYFQ